MRWHLETALKKLDEYPGAKIVKLWLATHPPLLKKGRESGIENPWAEHGVTHYTERQAMIGVVYENAVNNQRGREEQPLTAKGEVEWFTADALWNGAGKKVEGSRYLVEHRTSGQRYLCFKPYTTKATNEVTIISEKWWDNATNKELTPAEFEQLRDFLPASKRPSKVQGVEREVFWRTVMVDNVVGMQWGSHLFLTYGR